MDNSKSKFHSHHGLHGSRDGIYIYCRKLPTLIYLTLLLCISLPSQLSAQSFQLDDTISEYPHHGTIYANRFEGRKTSSGEVFRQSKFTAAHWKIKLGTYVLVTNPKTNLQVVVKVNDRCPKRGVFDLTRTAAHAIGILGCQPVTIRILSEEEQAYWAEQCEKQDRTDHTKPAKSKASTKVTENHKTESKATKPTKETKTDTKAPAQQNADSLYYNIKLGDVQTLSQAREAIRKLPTPYQDLVEARPSQTNASIELIMTISQHKNGATKVLKNVSNTFPNSILIEVKKN